MRHMRNYYEGQGLCYLPKAEGNTNQRLNNSSYPARTEFNNCFIIYFSEYTKKRTLPLRKPFVFSRFWHN